MTSAETLVTFLNAHRADREPFTHTSFGRENAYSIPGKMFIGDDELDRFYQLYIDWVDVNNNKICIVERNTEISPLRVDFDFLYDATVTENQHTRDQVMEFVSLYMREAKRYLQIPAPVEVFVSEKRKPTKKQGDKMSAGVHILVPSLPTTKWIEMEIRKNLLPKLPEIFGSLPLVEKDWEKVYDRGVAARSANWMMYHAQKSDGLPYKTKYIATWDPQTDVFSVSTDVPEMSVELLKRVSVRVDSSRAIPLTTYAQEEFGNVAADPMPPERHNTAITGGRAMTPMRGRPAVRGGAPGSRELSPNAPRHRPLTEEEKNYYRNHVMNLAEDRFEDYEKWMGVGICLWNIHPNDLHDVWHEFSAQSPKYKFREAELKWGSFSYRVDGMRLSKKSLLFWSRTDNLDGYIEIEKSNVDAMIEQSVVSGTEYDIAQVVHAKFHDSYCCAHFSKDAWFKFNGQIWTETDKGVDLLAKLSDDVWKMYNRRRGECALALNDLPDCGSKTPDGCATCKMKEKENAYTKMCKLLKSTNFKTNVMKEARLLFYDTEFIRKVNENPHLFAFRNCVFDTETMTFRDGKQEDYIMFCAPFDFDPSRRYDSYESWPDVELFLRQILPEDDVREYVMKYLATCLSGTNEAQKFHIWTGTGANGKSMLMNLMEESMGDYATKANIAMFTMGRTQASGANPEVVKLRGKRFVTMSEPDEDYGLNVAKIKEYTSGEKVTARDLFAGARDMLEFVLRCKFNLGCNDLPRINSTDNGTWRRIVQLRFNSEFRTNPKPGQYKLDETIQQKVRSVPWAQAFIAYLVHIYITNNGCKNLMPPERIIAYTSEYREDSDAIARFIRDCLRPVQEGEVVVPVRREMLQETFRSWRVQTEQLRIKMDEMLKRIETAYGKYPKGNRHTPGGWRNFQIVEQD